jgi:hypothetical protein
VRTGRSAGGDNGTMETRLGDHVNLDGGVTARIVDGSGVDLGNGHDNDFCPGGEGLATAVFWE